VRLFVRILIFPFYFFFFFIFSFSSKTYAATPTPTPVQESALKLSTIRGDAVNQKILKNALLAPAVSNSSVSNSETLVVPSDGATVQSSVLKNGEQYIITISGTFIWGNCDKTTCPNGGPDYKRYGDAGYLTDDHWASFADPFWSYFIYLNINDNYFMPDAYSSEHTYSLDFTGSGSPITFKINDCSYCYPDNSGYLTVEIKPAPKTPLILIPGIGGSELKINEMKVWSENDGHGGMFTNVYSAGEKVWVNTVQAILLGDDDYFDILKMQTDGSTSEANIGLTGNLTLEAYQSEIDFFIANGYILNQNLFVFPYDWRRDISLTAPLLDQKINEIKIQTGNQKVDIVAHSMGGLVARNYIADSARAQNVRKLFTLGTPHFGSVKFLSAITNGICLKFEIGSSCLSIATSEIKDIVQNMISGYELAPSQAYYNFYSGEDNNHPYPYKTETGSLNYSQTKALLKSFGYNAPLFNPSEAFHALDKNISNTNGVDVTVIAGSGQKTLGQIIEEKRISLLGIPYVHRDILNIDGDGTVPLFSASLNDADKNLSLFNSAKVFYTDQDHGNLVTSGPALNLVKNILNNNSQLPDRVSDHPYNFSGTGLSVHSPVNIHVYDLVGRHTGPTSNGDFETNIPGSSYDTLGDAKFVWLPDNGQYDIRFESTDQGSFDFKIREYENDTISQETLYKDIPLTISTRAEVHFDTSSDQSPIIRLDEDNNGVITDINPTSNLTGNAISDQTPPQTGISLEGIKGNNGWYKGNVKVALNSQDEASGSGILKTEYSLDNGQTINIYTEPFTIYTEKINKLKFRSIDNAGNEENPQEIEVKIDKTPPEANISVDPDKQDLIVIGVDTNSTTVIKYDNKLTKKKDDAFYSIADEAGNTLKLDVRERDKGKQDRFRVYSVQYNNDSAKVLSNNYFNVIYNGKRQRVNVKEQNFELKKEVRIRIQYDAKKNKSTIIVKENKKERVREVKKGLVYLNLLTDNGQLKARY
jgi:triacylglycerol esterase/lipase EstA (alpha/beta hydrolase family)